jgi:hypothetical protein
MRCPDCNKFVSFTDPEVEIHNVSTTEGSISVSGRVYLACVECGTELKERSFDLDADLIHECASICTCGHEEPDHHSDEVDEDGEPITSCRIGSCSCEEYDEENREPDFSNVGESDVDSEVDDSYEPQFDKRGKPVKARYQRHYFTIKLYGEAECTACEERVAFSMEEKFSASDMDELV